MVIAYDAPHMPFSPPTGNNYNSPNMQLGKIDLSEDQPPLGTQFKSYELNQASNYYTLDPFQYSITKFNYSFPAKPKSSSSSFNEFKNDPGLIYRDVDFEKLLSSFTATKKSVNDFPAQSYHRFLANDGYFNPKESTSKDLWYYGADKNAQENGIAGATLNLQETNHIIFPEAQRGGTDTKNLTKYSWSNYTPVVSEAWDAPIMVNNDANCQFFNYNSGYLIEKSPYQFDSNYCRNIGISSPYSGSMPFNSNLK
jgi:hypothetical protein